MKKPRPVASDQTFEAVGVATAAIAVAAKTSKLAVRFFMQRKPRAKAPRSCESEPAGMGGILTNLAATDAVHHSWSRAPCALDSFAPSRRMKSHIVSAALFHDFGQSRMPRSRSSPTLH